MLRTLRVVACVSAVLHLVRTYAQDVTVGACTCLDSWRVADITCRDGDVTYLGCGMAEPCDGDDGGEEYSWCLMDTSDAVRRGCNPAGRNWDYCVPPVVCAGVPFEHMEAQACFWDPDLRGVEWLHYEGPRPTGSVAACAAACCATEHCTGFEFPRDASYCAFWL
eukprot:SAG11_NODE_482_length_9072_cov_12.361306_1_plen_165_part_00